MQYTRRYLGALAESQYRHELSRRSTAVVSVHGIEECLFDEVNGSLRAALRRITGCQSLPGFERTVIFIDGDNVRTWSRWEEALGIHQAKRAGERALKNMALNAKDAGVGATAMKTENPRKMESALLGGASEVSHSHIMISVDDGVKAIENGRYQKREKGEI